MNKLISKIVGVALGLTLAVGTGVAIGVNGNVSKAEAATETLIIDGAQLNSSTATSGDTDKVYDGYTICFSSGAKQQSSSGTNKFTDKAIFIGKSGTYIYNKTALPDNVTKFEIYANKGASAKVSIGVNFSSTAISAYDSTLSTTYTATLSSTDNVYDCSSKLATGTKYFWYQVTNANNSQVQFRITYTTSAASVSSVTVNGDMTKKSYTTVESWDRSGLSASVAMSDSSSYSGDIDWSYNPISPSAYARSNENEVSNGSLSVIASAGGVDGNKTVTGINVNYATVAQGLSVIPNVNDSVSDSIVKGIVSRISSIDTGSYGNATYFISDDGETTSDELEIYRGYGVDGAHFTNTNDLMVGDSDVTLHETHENLPENGSIKWSSSDSSVATIGESSAVLHAVSAGTATIYAKIFDNNNVEQASNSIVVTVTEPILSIGDLVYFSAEYNSTTYYLCALGGSESSSSNESDKIVFTVLAGSEDDSYAFKSGDNYLKCTASSPYLGSGSEIDRTTSWTVVSDGTNNIITSVSSTTRKLMWNYNSGSPRYGAYTNTSATMLYPELTKVIVTDPTTLSMNTAAMTLGAGEQSEALTFTTDSPSATFNWISEDTSKATVTNGVVTGVANSGAVKIYVYFDTNGNGQFDLGTDLSAYCTVTLVAPSIDYSTITYGGTGVKVTSSNKGSYIKDGAKIIMAHADEVVAGAYGNFMLPSNENVTFGNNTVVIGDGTEQLTSFTILELEASSNGFYLKMKNGKYLSNLSSSAKAGNFAATDTGTTEWVVSENGIYDFSNEDYATIRFNPTANQERFKTYASTFGDNIDVYSFLEYTDEAEAYASNFLNSGLCGSDNNTKADSTIWGQQRTAFLALSIGAQTLLANGQANENATNNIQKCLARYDRVIYLHYTAEAASYPDFMNRVANNFVAPKTANTLFGVTNSTTMSAIVVITAILGFTTLGGYFFLRKKKEN